MNYIANIVNSTAGLPLPLTLLPLGGTASYGDGGTTF